MAKSVIFADGMSVFEPHENAPKFIQFDVSFHKEKFMEWLEKQETNKGGYVKVQICESGKNPGTFYASLNTYKGSDKGTENEGEKEVEAPETSGYDSPVDDDNLPF